MSDSHGSLDERRAFHALVLENVHDAIVATDEHLVLTAWNPAAEEMYGWTAAEVIGRDVREVVRSEYPEEQGAEAFRILLETGRFRTESVHHHRDGTPIQIEGNIVALRHESGRVMGFVFTYRNVTARKREQEELRRRTELLQTIIDNIPVMIRFLDRDGKVQLVNPMWERTLGWSFEEVQQRNLDLLRELYPDPLERQRALDFIAAATGEWADFRIRVRDGRIIDATLANIILSDGTNISIGQDITERKRAEVQLKETAQQLRALSARINSAKEDEGTRIAREIHDELGGALTTLRWDLGSLETMMTESVEPMQLLAAREKIRSMLRVTESTIDVVRRIAADLRPSMLDDLGLMEAIEWQCQQFQLRTGIICRWECSLENVDLSRDQSTAVFRILQEALTNIVRHARATRVDIRMKEEEGQVVLTVGDDGRGISEEEKSSSHALGLLGMRERAYLIRGRVEVTGVKGKGTKVTVRVPILVNVP